MAAAGVQDQCTKFSKVCNQQASALSANEVEVRSEGPSTAARAAYFTRHNSRRPPKTKRTIRPFAPNPKLLRSPLENTIIYRMGEILRGDVAVHGGEHCGGAVLD